MGSLRSWVVASGLFSEQKLVFFLARFEERCVTNVTAAPRGRETKKQKSKLILRMFFFKQRNAIKELRRFQGCTARGQKSVCLQEQAINEPFLFSVHKLLTNPFSADARARERDVLQENSTSCTSDGSGSAATGKITPRDGVGEGGGCCHH